MLLSLFLLLIVFGNHHDRRKRYLNVSVFLALFALLIVLADDFEQTSQGLASGIWFPVPMLLLWCIAGGTALLLLWEMAGLHRTKGQNFAITGVAPGTYDLVATKAGHLTYTIKGVVVGSTDLDLTKNANASVSTITLLAGDVDGDGNINESDVSVIRYASNINKLASSAANPLADVDGDGNVNESDVSIVRYAVHINKNAGHCTYVYAPKE